VINANIKFKSFEVAFFILLQFCFLLGGGQWQWHISKQKQTMFFFFFHILFAREKCTIHNFQVLQLIFFNSFCLQLSPFHGQSNRLI